MISGPDPSHGGSAPGHDPLSVNPLASDRDAGSTPVRPDGPAPVDLIPVRMLNEFTYCPRLGYLEWVQGEWAENLETLEGTFGHRNVDKPDRKQIPAPSPGAAMSANGADAPSALNADGSQSGQAPETSSAAIAEIPPADPIHTRSIMLSGEREGLLAKLDLLELDGRTATPVDYKRGHVPDLPEGAYEP